MEDFLKKEKIHDLLLNIKVSRNQTNKLAKVTILSSIHITKL